MINDTHVIELPEHSPLGASAADRWMNCPGSIALLKKFGMPETEEPDYTKQGTAAHAAASKCLLEGLEAWEVVGEKFGDIECDVEMSEAIATYLEVCRPLKDIPHGQVYIERHLTSRKHALMYGTVDFGVVADSLLNIVDYKHGIGVPVEVEDNPQLKYYAYLILQDHPDVRRVVMRVVQPRAIHPDGPVRRWETTAEAIHEWVEAEVIPAMHAAEIDDSYMAGKHCRFCPAKIVCPLLKGVFEAMATYNKPPAEMDDGALGREYQMIELVKMRIKALEAETLRRLMLCRDVEGTKLVHKRADRVFRDGAKPVFEGAFGPAAFTVPELRSPAQMEKLPGAKELVREWAYTPESGLTVALASDKRVAVKPQTAQEAFAAIAQDER